MLSADNKLLVENSLKYLVLSRRFLQDATDVLQDRTAHAPARDWTGIAWHLLWTLALSALILFLLMAVIIAFQVQRFKSALCIKEIVSLYSTEHSAIRLPTSSCSEMTKRAEEV